MDFEKGLRKYIYIINEACFLQQLERIKNEMDTMWKEAPAEVKEDYGKDYHFELFSSISRGIARAPSSFAPVVNAMEDALLSEDPKTRYLIAGGKGLFDNFTVRSVSVQISFYHDLV